MKQIMFVDDDPSILDGIRRSLRSLRKDWDMHFACSASEALEKCEEIAFDVVVSDMRMPLMDGADLLREIMLKHPGTIRFILSGHSDTQAIMRSVGVTHQFLNKPCNSENLQKSIARALGLKRLIDEDELRNVVSDVQSLPPVPTLYKSLVECLQAKGSTSQDVACIIRKDVGMTARILQLVNSAFFGLSRPVTTIERAVAYLGLDTIGSLVLSQGAFQAAEGIDLRGFDPDALARDGIRTASIAAAIARVEGFTREEIDQAFLAGMLHEIGKLVFAISSGDLYSTYIDRKASEPDIVDLEVQVFGANHAHVGAYLLGIWGLPNPVVEAIAYHENPSDCVEHGFGVFGAVHVACRIAAGTDVDESALLRCDTRYLESAGVLDHWPVWQDVIDRIDFSDDKSGAAA